ncbi:MAG: bifunctional DNA primase/polymerase [Bacteroidia bacterium]|nr:bifunctional DNA primase/polymerase [Bacteroidia bacterium]
MDCFKDLVKFGVDISFENNKKIVKNMPHNWNKLSKSIYNNEPNYGILTGKSNDIFVIDLDKKDDEFIGLKWIQDNFGNLKSLNTLITTTPSGGYHIYFKYTDIIKTTMNLYNLHIDILSENRCVFEGEMYNLFLEKPIRNLSQNEFDILLNIINNPSNNNNSKQLIKYDFSKINKKFNKPKDTTWEVEKLEKSIKFTPNCKECLVGDKQHSQDNHSCLFINNDKSVVKTCYSCGQENLDKKESKQIINIVNVILQKEDVENTVYKSLVKDIDDYGQEHSLKRAKHTGIVYHQVKPYAYVKLHEPMDFLNEIFLDDPDFKSHPKNIDNLIHYMKMYDSSTFPFIKFNKDYIGFSNGLYNLITCEFFENYSNNDIVCYKYIDKPFVFSMDTPYLDIILDYQFDSDVKHFIYTCLGRMFGIRDNFGFMLYLLGEAGCGKSLIIDIVCECFNFIGSINDSFERKYGLSYLYDKDIVVCDDLPKNIKDILPQQTFQSMITNGRVATAVKNKDAIDGVWNVPILFAGNWFPDYIDKGQISRRLLVANFEKNVYTPDTSLKQKIIDNELPNFIYKCTKYYKELLDKSANKSIWDMCPDYFKDQQEELRIERNPLYKYLIENTYFEAGSQIPLNEIKSNFEMWLDKKVSKLDHGTFGQVNPNYIIDKITICKSCKKKHKKGCCDDYGRTNRSAGMFVNNLKMNI